MMKQYLASYRDLPAYVYQFQTKLRHEFEQERDFSCVVGVCDEGHVLLHHRAEATQKNFTMPLLMRTCRV